MKRIFVLLACLLALTACDNQSKDTDQADHGSSQTEAQADAGNQQSSDQQKSDQSKQGQKDSDQKGEQQTFANQSEERSYALGMDIGSSLKGMPLDVNLDQLTDGIRDVVEGHKTRLSQKEVGAIMQGLASEMESAQKEKQDELADSNLKQGQEFLKKNKNKDGVKTLDDGLQYKVINKGSGPSPGPKDSVTVDYTGTLIDGTVFDSSKKRGKPATFPVDAVIPGWTEALQLMHEGGEYKLFIPPNLAYGKRGAGSLIGPNETLIFDVKLISVNRNQAADEKGDSKANQKAD